MLGCVGEDGWPNFRSARQPHPLKVTSLIPGIPAAEVSSSWKHAVHPSPIWGYTQCALDPWHTPTTAATQRKWPLPFPTCLEGGGQFLPSLGTLCILCLLAKSLPSLSMDKSKSSALKNPSSRNSLPHSTRACQLYLVTWRFSVLLSLGLAVSPAQKQDRSQPHLSLLFSP